jgi:prepilin-type processing-associated H-X9-DG protein
MTSKNKKVYIPLIIASIGAISFAAGNIFYYADLLVLFSLLLCVVSIVISIVFLIKDISQKAVIYKGIVIYIISAILSVVTISAFSFIKPFRFKPPSRVLCGSHLKGLGTAIELYAYEHNELYPECDNWCDIIVLYADVSPKQLICTDSNAVLGESSYAFNKNLAGKKSAEVLNDTVLLFETDCGKSKAGRTGTISSRYCYQEIKSKGEELKMFGKNPEKQKVYEDRWNQSGGPEILTAKHHKGFGANFLFADGRVTSIAKEDFNKLNWGDKTADPNVQKDKTN